MIFKSVDDKLKALGFVKNAEDRHGVVYRRWNEELGYAHRLDIYPKQDGNHMIYSYQEGVNLDGLNNTAALTYKEMKLAMKKCRQLRRKYKW